MNPVIKIDDQVISLTDSRPNTFLGLMIDKYLNWTDHGSNSIKSIIRFARPLKNIYICKPQTLKAIYFEYIHSIISFKISLYGAN